MPVLLNGFNYTNQCTEIASKTKRHPTGQPSKKPEEWHNRMFRMHTKTDEGPDDPVYSFDWLLAMRQWAHVSAGHDRK